MHKTDAMHAEPAWYRQFWPWFLISIPAATVCACMYTIFLAVTTSDSLVVRSDGGVDVATERLIAAEHAAARQDLTARLRVDRASGMLHLEVDNLPLAQRGESLSLEFSHPAFATRDHVVRLLPAPSDDSAAFVGQSGGALDDRWYLVLAHDDWRLSGTWDGSGDAMLSARGAR